MSTASARIALGLLGADGVAGVVDGTGRLVGLDDGHRGQVGVEHEDQTMEPGPLDRRQQIAQHDPQRAVRRGRGLVPFETPPKLRCREFGTDDRRGNRRPGHPIADQHAGVDGSCETFSELEVAPGRSRLAFALEEAGEDVGARQQRRVPDLLGECQALGRGGLGVDVQRHVAMDEERAPQRPAHGVGVAGHPGRGHDALGVLAEEISSAPPEGAGPPDVQRHPEDPGRVRLRQRDGGLPVREEVVVAGRSGRAPTRGDVGERCERMMFGTGQAQGVGRPFPGLGHQAVQGVGPGAADQAEGKVDLVAIDRPADGQAHVVELSLVRPHPVRLVGATETRRSPLDERCEVLGVPPPHVVGAAVVVQVPGTEGSHRLQQAVAAPAAGLDELHHRLVDERGDEVEDVELVDVALASHRGGRSQIEPADEDGEAIEEHLLVPGEQVVRPVECRLQAGVSSDRMARAAARRGAGSARRGGPGCPRGPGSGPGRRPARWRAARRRAGGRCPRRSRGSQR